jgi:elongator complex protein 3
MLELNQCAFIRELHVLGQHTNLKGTTGNAQHMGFGRRMIEKAEEIAIQNGFNKISIISGVGVREYYRKLGYELNNTFMMKEFKNNKISYVIGFAISAISAFIIMKLYQ